MSSAPDPLSFLSSRDLRRAQRLSRLVQLLRQKAWTRYALASRFRVAPKTIQRDLIFLRRHRYRLRSTILPHGLRAWRLA